MDDRKTVPSHIILFVDKTVSRDDISAFCTNIKKENPLTEITFRSYDNLSGDTAPVSLCDITGGASENRDDLFVITDQQSAVSALAGTGTACAGLASGKEGDSGPSGVLYVIEDLEFMTLSRIGRMWQRFHGIPWTITETERLIIREQTPEDLDRLYEIYDDDEVRKFVEPLYEDRKAEEEYLRKYIDNQYRFYEYGQWALVLKETSEVIGRAGISLREGYDDPELGYVIDKRYRRLGYAKEALSAIIGYGSDELDMIRFMAFTKNSNRSSVRLLESLGFERAGSDMIMGTVHDMYLLTLQQ